MVVFYALVGWAIRPGLIAYLAFLPAMVMHWRLNKGSCVLNNCETLLRTGRWRNPANREEGAWVQCLLTDLTGFGVTPRQVSLLSYLLVTMLWGLAWWHWFGWPTP